MRRGHPWTARPKPRAPHGPALHRRGPHTSGLGFFCLCLCLCLCWPRSLADGMAPATDGVSVKPLLHEQHRRSGNRVTVREGRSGTRRERQPNPPASRRHTGSRPTANAHRGRTAAPAIGQRAIAPGPPSTPSESPKVAWRIPCCGGRPGHIYIYTYIYIYIYIK